jgi:hypothetical protein
MAKQAQSWPDNQGPDDRHPTGSDGSEVNPGTKPKAQPPASQHPNPEAVDHAMIGEGGSGRKQEGARDEGLVNPPTVSLHPTSEPQGDAKAEIGEHRIIDDINFDMFKTSIPTAQSDLNYPFEELDIGMGMFVPVEQGSTTDALMSKLYKQVDQFKKQYSEQEVDENGDTVMEDVTINIKLRNEDGTVKLDGGTPRLSIKSGFRPKLIGPNFAVKAVVKGDKIGWGGDDDYDEAEADGALVIRLG